ncbi:MAG: prolyl oligopeptidase family serine peptidase [Pseudomonadota bacterium]
MFKSFSAIACASASAVAAAFAQPPVEFFARMPFLRSVDIAPDGNGLAAVVADDGADFLAVYDLTDGGFENTFAMQIADDTDPRWIRWKDDKTLLASLGFAASRAYRSADGRRFRTDTYETRLFYLKKNGGELTNVLDQPRNRRQSLAVARKGNKKTDPIQFEDDVISWMWSDPQNIVLQYNRTDPEHPIAFITPVKDKREKALQAARPPINSWFADAEGRIRGGRGRGGLDDDELVLLLRAAEEDDFRDISHRFDEIRVLGFDPDGRTAYVRATGPSGTLSLFTYDIPSDSIGAPIFSHPVFDIDSIVQNKKTGALLGVRYIAEEEETVWFDDAVEKEIGQVADALGAPARLESESLNSRFAVYTSSSAEDAGRYFILDRSKPAISAMPSQYPELSSVSLGEVVASEFSAGDGVRVPAFVTLPPGLQSLSDAKNLPFVIFPHGGPLARDFRRFDYMAQFFASRGYGVMQTNFRGSAGYGAEFDQLATGTAGSAMVTDIADGARWLVETGRADASRLAIVGGSYGGYAALQSLVVEADLYQCAIGLNGVYDLPAFIRDRRDYIGGRATQRFWRRLFGEGAALRDKSPALHGSKISRPVLLIHAEDDRIVDVNQSQKMRGALRGSVELVVLQNGGHGLANAEARFTALSKMETFLARCLG